MPEEQLATTQREHGAVWSQGSSQAHPVNFGDPAAEYTAANEAVALFDLTDRTSIELRGNDRQAFLNNFCTNDVGRLSPDEGCEAFLTNIKGRILAHLVVSATEDALWLDSEPGTAEFIVSHLDKYLITEEVEIVDRTPELAPLLLTGLEAEAWLAQHIDGFTSPPLCGQAPHSLDGFAVTVRRFDFTAHPGFQLIASRDDVANVWSAITDSGVRPAGSDAFEALRIEAGFPRYGVDITDQNIAQEASRSEQAISFTKGCYLGQEPIARLDALGHTNKALAVIRLSAPPAPARGTTVTSSDGNQLGHITSAALNPTTGAPVALAILKSAALPPGTDVFVEETSATVIPPTTSLP